LVYKNKYILVNENRIAMRRLANGRRFLQMQPEPTTGIGRRRLVTPPSSFFGGGDCATRLTLKPIEQISALQGAHESDQITFFLLRELHFQDQIEELDCVFQREKTSIVEVWGRLLHATKRKGLDRTI
jgi:hypothetical protein